MTNLNLVRNKGFHVKHYLRNTAFAISLMATAGSVLMAPNASARTSKQPKVLVLATGGTIAGKADARSAIGYNAGQVTGQQLVAGIPGIGKLARLLTDQISNIPSQDMNDHVWHKLAQRINRACAHHEADGIVVTHGTDTMEETAFFLDNVISKKCTVVITGAMRPSTAISADGPANLYAAVKVAASKQARGRGVTIVMNNNIHAARWATKTNTTSLQTFKSPNHGVIGYVDEASVRFVSGHLKDHRKASYSIPRTTELPRVEIVYMHSNMDGREIDMLVRDGVRGIILAGAGDGNTSASAVAALKRAHDKGVIVVRSSHVGSGFVNRNVEVNDDKNGFIVSYDLNPQKARILTQLLIADGNARKPLSSLQKAFAF